MEEISRFSITTDLWTSASHDSYLSLIMHYIDKQWNLKSINLETTPMFEDHTGVNLYEALTEILENWNLPLEKVACVTTDNGSNFIAAFSNQDILRLSCFGLSLDLAISEGLQLTRVEMAIKKCRALVETFSRSWKRNRDLREKQESLGLPSHKLIGNVVTRWGSTYAMISRIIEQQQPISAVLTEDRKNWHKMFTDEEFKVIEALSAVLEPLSYLTDALSGEKTVTLSAIHPVMKHIIDVLTMHKDTDSRLTKEIKQNIKDDIIKRYDDDSIQQLLDKAAFLDPRFKKCLSNYDDTIEVIQEEALANLGPIVEEPTNTEIIRPAKKVKGLGAVLNHIADDIPSLVKASSSLSPTEKISKEVNDYCDEAVMPTDTDALQWWKMRQNCYPALANLAKHYLYVCATSMPSERIFSKSGYICSKHRNRLLQENVNILVFLSANL